jgi:hypothetical protein
MFCSTQKSHEDNDISDSFLIAVFNAFLSAANSLTTQIPSHPRPEALGEIKRRLSCHSRLHGSVEEADF